MNPAILKGHFELTSGQHSDTYIQTALLLDDPWSFSDNAFMMAMRARKDHDSIDYVISPAVGALPIGYEVSRQLGVPFLFTERVHGEVQLRRGFEIREGKNYVVVEDVVTSGGSVKEVIDLVKSGGGKVIRVACIVSRASKNPFKVPFDYVDRVEAQAWDADKCSLCAENEPIQKPGSRNLR